MKTRLLYIAIVGALVLASCKKYLSEKSDIHIAVPTTVAEYQAILDDNNMVEYVSPGVADLGTDDYYVESATYPNLHPVGRSSYKWDKDIFQGFIASDWNDPYGVIYRANVVLKGLEELDINGNEEQIQWNNAYGHALLSRGMMHYYLEEIFGQPYRPSSANTDLGIPLKLSSNLADRPVRSNVKLVFEQILSDLKQAVTLLPVSTIAKNRPSKAAGYAILSRVYLTMQDYPNAGKSADSSLKYNSSLISYDTISGNNPFGRFGPPRDYNFSETLMYITASSWEVLYRVDAKINMDLYNSYDPDDLRKTVFFRARPGGYYTFKGYYSGNALKQFTGPAVDEMYLNRAECYAREGNKDSALSYLNKLLITRWKQSVVYPNIEAVDAEDALKKILVERRKELLFRGIRWSDLRRLNQDPRFAVTLERVIDGVTYTLPPNDPKYVYPIPANEIQLGGIEQNPR